jgi:hypothetical protein
MTEKSTDLFDIIAEDLAEKPDVSDGYLGQIGKLAQKQLDLEKEIIEMEENLGARKKDLRLLTEYELPSLMDEIQMGTIGLVDGTTIEVKTVYQASISKANQVQAFEWLRENNQGDLIKNQLVVEFGMGQDEQAEEIKTLLQQKDLSPTQKMSVHPSTLKAFVKTQLEGGRNLPHDLLGVYIGRQTKLSFKKEN